MENNIIGQNIAHLRKENNMSQSDLAKILNVSNKTISKWECGNGIPDVSSLKIIANTFNVSIDELVSASINKENNKDCASHIECNQRQFTHNTASKKTIISICVSISLVAVLTITLLCYFLVPRKPMVDDSNLFDINNDNRTLYCSVDNSVDIISINEQINVPRTNKWGLFYDKDGKNSINSSAIDLKIGDNIFYLIITNNANEQSTYTVTIRRKPLYVVTFDTIGGVPVQNQIIMEGELASFVTPQKEGYIFNGWDFDFSQPITQNVTIKANWIAKNLTVTYIANNGNEDNIIQDVTYDSNTTLKTANAFKKIGYTLSSWNTKADGSGVSYSVGQIFANYNIAENISLYAQWTINLYSISCNKNIENAGVINGEGVFEYSTQHVLTVITNIGYTWIGWYNEKDELINSSTSLSVTLSDSDFSCKAKWVANDYVITLDVNGGNPIDKQSNNITFGNNFSLPIPSRTEAHFVGWYYDGIQYTDEQGNSLINWDIANNVTLVAKWDVNKYLVTVNTNTNKGGTIIGAGLQEYGSTVSLTATTNDGYTFIGWFDGNNLISEEKDYNILMTNTPIVLTAKWQANSYTVSMDVKGGTTLPKNTKDVVFDNSFYLPTTTKNGYCFKGWFLHNNGDDIQITDSDGICIDVWSIAQNATLYAKWDVEVYTISYSLNGGTIVGSNPETYTIEDLDIRINNPKKEGYIFTGWVGSDIQEKELLLTILAGSTGNRIFGASWVEDSSFKAISTVAEFLAINDDLSGKYYLENDIDLDGVSFDGFGTKAVPFSGIFDGKGRKIVNCTINTQNSFGIFKYSTGIIQNVGIERFNATVTSSDIINGAGLVLYNYGIIKNVYWSGAISGTMHSCGALVFENDGKIFNSYTIGEITKSKDGYASGFANINTGEIINSFSNVNITASSSSYAVGFCADNKGNITNAFATGNVSGGNAGGFIWSDNGQLQSCFRLDSQKLTAYSDYEFNYNRLGKESTQDELQDLEYLDWRMYETDNYIFINENAVWKVVDGEYPKLYWEM